MKKGIKFTAAAAIAISALTPVAVFANEIETPVVENGLYTVGKYLSVEAFQALSKAEKKAFLVETMTAGKLAYVLDGKVYDLGSEEVQNAPASELEKFALDFDEYSDKYDGIQFGEGGLVEAAPIEKLVVESVSAITTTAVEFNIKALTEDNEALEVEVKDGKGNIVATKSVAVSAGETTITVEFETAVKTADLVGVWTVNGVEFNLDALNQLEAIIEALEEDASQLDLYNALEDASIDKVNEALIDAYKTALADAELTSLEDVQTIINEVNADNVSASEAAENVKEIFSAQENQVTLSKALNNHLERVNSEWISEYQEILTDVFGDLTADEIDEQNAVELLETLQLAIDMVNFGVVGEKFAAVESTIDTSKFGEVRTLINTYKVDLPEAGVDVYGYFTDVLDYQTAIAAVTTASTNSALLTALNKLDTALKQYTEKYEGVEIADISGFKDGADRFDLTKVNTDSTSLSEYRKAIKAVEEVGSKNQAKDILTIIEGVNETLNNTAIATALENLNGVTNSTSATKVVEYLKAAQDLDSTLTATTKNEIKSAYAEAYKAAVLDAEDFDAVTDVNGLVGTVNTSSDAAALLKALNDATTAAEVSAALIELGSEEFINVHADDKLTVAAAVLAARNTLTSKKFDAENPYTTAVTTAVAARSVALNGNDDVNGANDLNSDSTITDAQAVLALVAPTAYAALSNQAKVDAGQALLDSLEFNTDGNLKTPFKTLKAVLTAAGL